jgi:hypothetical protein
MDDYLIGHTLDSGAYLASEYLMGAGSRFLLVGTRTDRPSERYFLSVVWAPKGPSLAELRRELGYAVPGVLEMTNLCFFDRPREDPCGIFPENYCSLIERIPDGDWLPPVVASGVGAAAAVSLGFSVGQILERAAHLGTLLVGVRPEYIWARRESERLIARGLTARNHAYFFRTAGACMPGFRFERHYYAPEVYRGQTASPESLVFTLATMIAEWATGAYPFPDARAHGDMSSLIEGRHAPLDVPAPLASLLALALKPEPAHRPSLPYFLRRLRLLAPAP